MSKKFSIFNFQFSIFLIAIILILITPTKVRANNPRGYLDVANCDSFQGWTCDPDSFSSSIDVRFYDGGAQIDQILANQIRSDLSSSSVCEYTANHGFWYPTPESLKNGQPHSISAYGINIPASAGDNTLLTNSPRSITCTRNATYVSQTPPPPTMTPGQTASVSITMNNNGSVTWNPAQNYRLGSQNPQDNQTWGLGRVNLGSSVSPGSNYTFNFNVTAPSTPGTYNFQWRMVKDNPDGAWFGSFTPNYTVNVAIPNCNTGSSCLACSNVVTANTTCPPTNNSTQTCTYNSYTGGGSCNPVTFSQPCSIDSCQTSQNWSCQGGTCWLMNCNAPPLVNCSACVITNSTKCANNGTQTCNYSTRGEITSCTPYATSNPCTVPNCDSGYSCSSETETCIPNCDSGMNCLGGTCNATPNTCAANNGTWSGCTYTAISGGVDCSPVVVPDGSEPCTTNACSGGYVCDPSTNTCRNPAFSTQCPEQTLNPRAEGLISAPDIFNNFGNRTGQCAISSQVSFTPSTYEVLKSTYYIQAKDNPALFINKNNSIAIEAEGQATQANISMGSTEDQLYHINGDLNLTLEPTGTKTGMVFVEGNLFIGPFLSPPGIQFNYGDSNSGIVFIVKGNVIIDSSMTQIDAVIISSGTIYTAGAGCSLATNIAEGTTNSQLTIYGSLISLDPDKPIQFCRTLGASNDTTPAEKINQQPKYLVLLRKLYSITLEKWSEIP